MPDQPRTPEEAEDDNHRKYREALARKRGRATDSGVGRDTGSPKTAATTSNAKTQRLFRRKSG